MLTKYYTWNKYARTCWVTPCCRIICRIGEHCRDNINWQVPGCPRGVVHWAPCLLVPTFCLRVLTLGLATLSPSISTRDLTLLGLALLLPPPNSIDWPGLVLLCGLLGDDVGLLGDDDGLLGLLGLLGDLLLLLLLPPKLIWQLQITDNNNKCNTELISIGFILIQQLTTGVHNDYQPYLTLINTKYYTRIPGKPWHTDQL